MRLKHVKISILLLFGGMGMFYTHAQESIATAGGNASSSEGTVSYTVGQVLYSPTASANGSLSPGVQQPFEFFVISSVNETLALGLEMNAYPNPAINQVTLNMGKEIPKNLTFKLFDLEGKLLIQGKILYDKQIIPMQELSPATYLLHVLQNDSPVKSFKIVKNE